MKITLTQDNLKAAIAVYLRSRGMEVDASQPLEVEFSSVRKPSPSVSAEVTLGEAPVVTAPIDFGTASPKADPATDIQPLVEAVADLQPSGEAEGKSVAGQAEVKAVAEVVPAAKLVETPAEQPVAEDAAPVVAEVAAVSAVSLFG